jgi:hypothetical protein
MSTDAGPPSQPEKPSLPVPTKPISDILAPSDGSPSLPVDASAAALGERLQKEIDGRNEDKFYFISFGVILLDALIFKDMSSVAIVCLFLLELIVLLGLAKRFGNEHVSILLEILFHRVCKLLGRPDGD